MVAISIVALLLVGPCYAASYYGSHGSPSNHWETQGFHCATSEITDQVSTMDDNELIQVPKEKEDFVESDNAIANVGIKIEADPLLDWSSRMKFYRDEGYGRRPSRITVQAIHSKSQKKPKAEYTTRGWLRKGRNSFWRPLLLASAAIGKPRKQEFIRGANFTPLQNLYRDCQIILKGKPVETNSNLGNKNAETRQFIFEAIPTWHNPKKNSKMLTGREGDFNSDDDAVLRYAWHYKDILLIFTVKLYAETPIQDCFTWEVARLTALDSANPYDSYEAIKSATKTYSNPHRESCVIQTLDELLLEVVGLETKLVTDTEKPEVYQKLKLFDSSTEKDSEDETNQKIWANYINALKQ